MNNKPDKAGLGARAAGTPVVAGRAAFQAELDALRVREKAHTREGDAIAADAPTTSAPPGAERIR